MCPIVGVSWAGENGAPRPTPAGGNAATRRYVDEIRPLVEAATFLTATDLGTVPDDLRTLPGTEQADLMHTDYMGMPLDAYLTGLGVATAAETVLGGLEGRTVAIEGFGKVGGATAVEMAKRGARLVAFSTIHGSVRRPGGFGVDELLDLRARYGDRLVAHLGAVVGPAADLFNVDADVIVPGARIGVIDETRAGSLSARVVAPGANRPYTAGALEVLKERGIPALADFVTNAGAPIGYITDGLQSAAEAVDAVEKRVRELTRASLEDRQGPLSGARRVAEAHLRTWLDP